MQETLTQSEVAALMRGEHVKRKPAKQPATSLRIVLPIPSKHTHPNSRTRHVQTHARAAKKQRIDAAIAAKLALINGNHEPPLWHAAKVQIELYRESAKAKPHDTDNLIAWCKHYFDGLQDAGIVRNDRGLIHTFPIQRIGKEACGRNELVLNISVR